MSLLNKTKMILFIGLKKMQSSLSCRRVPAFVADFLADKEWQGRADTWTDIVEAVFRCQKETIFL
jgi:hypothetical protein